GGGGLAGDGYDSRRQKRADGADEFQHERRLYIAVRRRARAPRYNPQPMASSIRVLHFGLGPIGAAIVKQVAARPGFKIVGGVDIDPAKAGRDLGDVVGLAQRLGVKVFADATNAPKATKRDVVVLC